MTERTYCKAFNKGIDEEGNFCRRSPDCDCGDEPMNKQEKLNELQRITGKGKMACDIALSLAGGDIDKAIERMKKSYPGLEVKK